MNFVFLAYKKHKNPHVKAAKIIAAGVANKNHLPNEISGAVGCRIFSCCVKIKFDPVPLSEIS